MKNKMNNILKRIKKVSWFNVGVCLFLSLYFVVLLSLFVYGFYASLKNHFEFSMDPISLPKWPGEWENYLTVFETFSVKVGANQNARTWYVEHMFAFSCLYAVGSALAITLATTLMAYACSMFPCKMSSIFYGIVLFSMAFTVVGALPSEMQMVKTLNLYNSFVGNWFMKFSFLNVYFLVMYEAFRGVAKDYREAAQIDGASEFVIMVTIMFRMVTNIMGSIFVVQFIRLWNDYSAPLLYLPDYPTLAYGLVNYTNNSASASEPFKLAASIICVVPLLIFFLAFQKKLIGNLSAGGIKG